MWHEIAVLDQLIQVVLDRAARGACDTDDVFDLDLSALPRQLIDAQGKLGKLSQDFLLAFNPRLQAFERVVFCVRRSAR